MNLPSKPMYLTAGNFPSQAANTIQVAKMAAAYARWLPNLEIVTLTGPLALIQHNRVDIREMFGLSRQLKIRYLPLLIRQKEAVFNEKYRPPKWFYTLVGRYAKLRRADLVFTRKSETAVITVTSGIDTILEAFVPWKNMPEIHKHSDILLRPSLRTLVVITPSLAESFIAAGVPKSKVLIEPDGVDLEQYTPAIDKFTARNKLGLPRNVFLCIHTGHMYRDRGIENIINASRYLPDIYFLMVGGWEKDVAHYHKLIKDVKNSNIEFTGLVPQSRVPLYQFAADILLMQYSSKLITADHCSPLKLFEYLATGRPIISTDLPILHSVLRHEENALFIKPDSGVELVKAIKKIRDNPRLGKFLAKNARQDSLNYSWDKRAKRILIHALGGL